MYITNDKDHYADDFYSKKPVKVTTESIEEVKERYRGYLAEQKTEFRKVTEKLVLERHIFWKKFQPELLTLPRCKADQS